MSDVLDGATQHPEYYQRPVIVSGAAVEDRSVKIEGETEVSVGGARRFRAARNAWLNNGGHKSQVPPPDPDDFAPASIGRPYVPTAGRAEPAPASRRAEPDRQFAGQVADRPVPEPTAKVVFDFGTGFKIEAWFHSILSAGSNVILVRHRLYRGGPLPVPDRLGDRVTLTVPGPDGPTTVATAFTGVHFQDGDSEYIAFFIYPADEEG